MRGRGSHSKPPLPFCCPPGGFAAKRPPKLCPANAMLSTLTQLQARGTIIASSSIDVLPPARPMLSVLIKELIAAPMSPV